MNVIERMGMAAMLATVAWVVAAGCDKPAPPPDISRATPPGPTTEALVNGPRHSVNLEAAPLYVRAPMSWEIKRPGNGSIVFLHGPDVAAPHGDVDIQVSRIPVPASMTLDQTRIQTLIAAAKKEMEQSPGDHLVAELRNVGGLQLLEVVTADSPATRPSDIPAATTCTWNTLVFIPRGAKFDEISLSVLGMTVGQYNQDADFLRSIINSVSEDSSSPSGGT